MWHAWGRREMPRRFWHGIMKERDQLEDLSVDVRIMRNGS
jgi:hypothetical protein